VRQWIGAPVWQCPRVAELLARSTNWSPAAPFDRWLAIVIDEGLDPL
jgi:hypothetical protein